MKRNKGTLLWIVCINLMLCASGIPAIAWGLQNTYNGCNPMECEFIPSNSNTTCIVVGYSNTTSAQTCRDPNPCPDVSQINCYYMPPHHPCYSFTCSNPYAQGMVIFGTTMIMVSIVFEIIIMYVWYKFEQSTYYVEIQ